MVVAGVGDDVPIVQRAEGSLSANRSLVGWGGVKDVRNVLKREHTKSTIGLSVCAAQTMGKMVERRNTSANRRAICGGLTPVHVATTNRLQLSGWPSPL